MTNINDLGSSGEGPLPVYGGEVSIARLPLSRWQPIETAPRDGTEVLVYGLFAGEINGPCDKPEYGIACHTGGTPRTDYPGFDWYAVGGDAYAVWAKPTHWMPLPS